MQSQMPPQIGLLGEERKRGSVLLSLPLPISMFCCFCMREIGWEAAAAYSLLGLGCWGLRPSTLGWMGGLWLAGPLFLAAKPGQGAGPHCLLVRFSQAEVAPSHSPSSCQGEQLKCRREAQGEKDRASPLLTGNVGWEEHGVPSLGTGRCGRHWAEETRGAVTCPPLSIVSPQYYLEARVFYESHMLPKRCCLLATTRKLPETTTAYFKVMIPKVPRTKKVKGKINTNQTGKLFIV